MLTWLRSLTNSIFGRHGKPSCVDTATRMAIDADFSDRGEPRKLEREPVNDVDPIDEVMRIVGEQVPVRPLARNVQTFLRRHRLPKSRR